ncbi:MAG: AAA family ATPase [Exilibacterium sp.]
MWRKIQMELAAWYRRDDRKPLIIRGARQVGKSTLVQLAAEQLGLRLLTVNLEEPTPLAAPLARGDIDEVVLSLDLHFDVDLRKNSCLLFFDEIQARPEVIALLRYFYEKYPQIAVVAAGSLLDFELSAPGFSMPVGRTEFLHLGPMNFEEFLAATGQQRLLNYLQTYSLADEFNETAHLKLSEYLRHYLLVGGMPAVVKHWAETADLNEAFRLKSNLTTAFALDFHKYRGKVDTGLLTRLYTALPAMVGRKIKYSEMAPDVRVEKTKHALQQLYLARIAYGVNHTSAQGLPLAATQNPKVAKPLCLDVGLMLSQLGLSPSAVLESRDITLINEGQLAEQFIGQHENPHCIIGYGREDQTQSSIL